MALPTPLHPAQAEATAVKAEFNTGPHEGMVLLVAKNDPNLAGAVASGEVVLPGPFATAVPVAVPTNTVQGGTSTVSGSTVAGGSSTVPSSDPPGDTI